MAANTRYVVRVTEMFPAQPSGTNVDTDNLSCRIDERSATGEARESDYVVEIPEDECALGLLDDDGGDRAMRRPAITFGYEPNRLPDGGHAFGEWGRRYSSAAIDDEGRDVPL